VTACIKPVAPTGWPHATRPIEGFTGNLPCRVECPYQ
jgi:hypothetical protein